MYLLLLIAHFIICFMLIGLILIQHGKGAQTGAAFGSGASQTVFGSQGSGGFLSRTTAILAGLFFALNLFLVWYLNREYHPKMIEVPVTSNETLPGKNSSAPAQVPANKQESSNDIPKVD